MKSALLCLFVLCTAMHAKAQYVLQTLEHRWNALGIVAVVDVGPISEVSTPQGLILQSATAKITRLIYRKFEPFPEIPKNEVILYSFMPNGFEVICPAPLRLTSGPAFIMMQQQGTNRFFPSDPWDFQSLTTKKILWPQKLTVEERDLDEVIMEIQRFIATHPKDPDQ